MASRKNSQHGAAARKRRSTGSGRAPAQRTRKTAPKRRSSAGPSRALSITLVTLALLAVTAWSFYPAARIQYQEAREKARLEAELEVLQERNEELRTQVDRLKTPEGVEEVARESLGMVKDGEHAYVVTNLLQETTNTAAACASISEPPPTLTQSLLDSIFGVQD
jgi:cell division protein FtsL